MRATRVTDCCNSWRVPPPDSWFGLTQLSCPRLCHEGIKGTCATRRPPPGRRAPLVVLPSVVHAGHPQALPRISPLAAAFPQARAPVRARARRLAGGLYVAAGRRQPAARGVCERRHVVRPFDAL